ncbi:MAG TPA: hypothetical protein VIA06_09005 [Candidatus Dormibacteraeota bacterium]|jgi:hypothetical protein|nr:hypothetical protein [Candidatus Dormibacteraeota bacterium]
MKRFVFALAGSLLWLAVVAMVPPGLHVSASSRSAAQVNAGPTATPTATPTPAESPTPTPTPAGPPQSPSINLSSSSGPAGSQFIVSGTDFTPGAQVEVFVDTPNRPMGPTFTAGQDGSFQQEVAVPDGEGSGTHNICATAQISPVCAQFTVLAGVPVTPTPTAAPTPTPTATPTAAATATPIAISSVPQGSKSALSTLFPWILIPILALLLIAAAALYIIVRGRSETTPRTTRPTAGTGIPIVTHLSPKSGAAPPSSEDPPQDDYSSLPPTEVYSPPQAPTFEVPPPRDPEPPAALPGPRPQLPGAGIDPPRAAGGDDDVDRPEPSD